MSKAPYGTWLSKIDASVIVSGVITFDDVVVDPITQTIYHLEESPKDGRCIIVKSEDDQVVLPPHYSARTFVQEYGGAPAIVYNNIIYFSNDTGNAAQRDNKIYSLDLSVVGSKPKPITPENPLLRYANFAIHPTQTNLLVTLREDHTDDPDGTNPGGVVNTICVVDTTLKTPVKVIVSGAGFYTSPVLNPSGKKIAWQEWDLPDMPWQGGIVKVADVTVDSGSLTVSNPVLVAGKKGTESATFPSWITDSKLAYTTDATNGFQNPYIFHTDTREKTPVLEKPLTQDFAEPAWYLGLYPYAILGDGAYGIFTAFKDGGNIFYIIDLTAPSDPVLISPPKDSDYTVAQHVRRASDNTFVFTASNSSTPGGVIKGTVSRSPGSYIVDFTVLKASAKDLHLERYISKPKPKTLPMSGGYSVYVVYYAPYNLDYSGPIDPNEKPPCIVGVHGGPTGLESQALNWTKMYYTSRGFAWLDVNYRGSSGYGRDYINLLNGKWGIYDVQDCKDAAKTLASDQYSLIDGNRVAIRGGSAGAYTTLASVTSAINPKDPQPYYKTTCGAYGCVADVETLAGVTEKFEMDYINTLFGSPPGPAWDSRNPIKHAGNLSVPLLLLQGLADGVVPPSIVRGFLSAITQLVPSAELEFAFYKDEGHHFKKEDTIKDALRREHNWYVDTLLPFD